MIVRRVPVHVLLLLRGILTRILMNRFGKVQFKTLMLVLLLLPTTTMHFNILIVIIGSRQHAHGSLLFVLGSCSSIGCGSITCVGIYSVPSFAVLNQSVDNQGECRGPGEP